MSDIGFQFDALTLVVVVLYITWSGILLGAVLGALLWKKHRVWGALIGAVVGCGLAWAWWLFQWWDLRD